MNDKTPHIEQKAEGIGNAQAAGDRATAISIFGIPIEKLLLALLVSSSLIQGSAYVSSLGSEVPWLYIIVIGSCFPFIFGLPAFFCLVLGVMLKNRNIVILSLVSGGLSLIRVFLLPLMIEFPILLKLLAGNR